MSFLRRNWPRFKRYSKATVAKAQNRMTPLGGFKYRTRMDVLRRRILQNAQRTLGGRVLKSMLQHVGKRKARGKDFFFVGVLIKRYQRMQPRFIWEFAHRSDRTLEHVLEHLGTAAADSEALRGDPDDLWFEDGSTRKKYKVTGAVDADQVVTGMVVGIYGRRTRRSIIRVKQLITPALPPQIEWPIVEQESFVLFLSDLRLSTKMEKNESVFQSLDLLCKWLSTEVLLGDDDIEIISRISRIVIIGDTFDLPEMDASKSKTRIWGRLPIMNQDVVEYFDRFLERLLRTIPVDLMPGTCDSGSGSWPYQPVDRLLFPKSSTYLHNFQAVMNPYAFAVSGLRFLGISGHNLHELYDLEVGLPTLGLMEQCLRFGHLVPTTLDTEPTPTMDRDPLVFEELPHVFFAGNQRYQEDDVVEFENGSRTMLLTVPSFRDTSTALLFSTKTLRYEEYEFDLFDGSEWREDLLERMEVDFDPSDVERRPSPPPSPIAEVEFTG